MNIIEAIESGKYFRRSGMNGWYIGVANIPMQGIALYKLTNDVCANTVYVEKVLLKVADILADDWEVKE